MANSSTIMIAVMLLSQVKGERQIGVPDLRCGGYCLFVALRAIDLGPGSYEELEKSLGSPGDRGYAMSQLDEQARKFGATTMGVKTSLENLLARDESFGCICLLRSNHFVLLRSVDRKAGVVVVVDAPGSYRIPIDTFKSLWNGEALLIGRTSLLREEFVGSWSARRWIWFTLGITAIVCIVVLCVRSHQRARRRTASVGLTALFVLCATAPGCDTPPATDKTSVAGEPAPDLVIEPAHQRMGIIPIVGGSVSRVLSTKLRNAGKNEIVIRQITQSCGCTTVSLDRDRIAPGTQAVLTTRIMLGFEPGPRQSSVTLTTSDLEHPISTISFEWQIVDALRTVPEESNFWRLGTGDRKSTRIAVVAEDLPVCERCIVKATSSSPLVACEFFPSKNRLPGPADVTRGSPAPITLGELQVDVTGDDEIRAHKESVDIQLQCGNAELARYRVPVAWELSPLLRVLPSRIWLGSRPAGQETSFNFLITATDGKPFRLERIDCGDPGVLKKSHFRSGPEAAHTVNLVTRMPRTEGPWRTMIRVVTDRDDARELVIPLSAIIVASVRE